MSETEIVFRKRPPKWIKYAFMASMFINPATWVTVAWKMYRERDN